MNQNLSNLSYDIFIIYSLDDEVAGGEPTAIVIGALTGGDTVGQGAIIIDGDVVKPDAVPTVALAAISRSLVDVEGGNEVMIAGTLFETA